MTDPIVSPVGGDTVPAPVVPVVVPPVVAPPAVTPAPAAAAPASSDPSWLPDRIKRAEESAQRSLLKSLGYEKPEDVQSALADLKKRRDAEKTESERLTAENATLRARAAKADEYETIYAAQVKAELSKLTPEQSALVVELAGDDPAKQAKAIDRMRAGGMLAAPQAPLVATPVVTAPAVTTPVAAPPTAPAAPATTAPTVTAPNPTPATGESHLAEYEQLQKSNPALAANYLLAHYAQINAQKKTRA